MTRLLRVGVLGQALTVCTQEGWHEGTWMAKQVG